MVPRVLAWRALGVGAFVVGANVGRAQSLVHVVPGQASGEQFGTAVTLTGDLDGDGRADFLGTSTTAAQNRGVVRAYSGVDAHLIWAVEGTLAGQRFGATLARLGDVDGDGRDDLIVGAWSASFPSASQAGLARVLSGASGATLRDHRGDSTQDHFGWTVAGLGDVDGDLVLDYAVGAVDDDDFGGSSGSVRIFSGASGAVIRTHHGNAAEQLFGASIASVPDADGDGRDDVAIGAPYFAVRAEPGYVRLLSGATGVTLWTIHGSADHDQFGGAVAGLADLDGDALGEVACGARQLQVGAPGYVRIVAGSTGGILREIVGGTAGARFGTAVAAAGDVDYDGLPDLWIGAPESDVAGSRSGRIDCHAGSTGELLARFEGAAANARLGTTIVAGPDVTGEGGPDAIAGATGEAVPGTNAGAIRVVRPSDELPPPPPDPHEPLESDRTVISWSARESQHLELRAPSEHAGRRFLFLGSASGTAPGFHANGIHVPLNRDRFMLAGLISPSFSALDPVSGRFDDEGGSSSELRLERRHRAWIGHTFDHAYVVLDRRCRVVFASNPVSVTIVP